MRLSSDNSGLTKFCYWTVSHFSDPWRCPRRQLLHNGRVVDTRGDHAQVCHGFSGKNKVVGGTVHVRHLLGPLDCTGAPVHSSDCNEDGLVHIHYVHPASVICNVACDTRKFPPIASTIFGGIMTTCAPESGKLQALKGDRIPLVRPLFLCEFLSISTFTLAAGCGFGLPRFHDCVTGSNTWWPRAGDTPSPGAVQRLFCTLTVYSFVDTFQKLPVMSVNLSTSNVYPAE